MLLALMQLYSYTRVRALIETLVTKLHENFHFAQKLAQNRKISSYNKSTMKATVLN